MRGGAFFNGKEGRDDFRTNLLAGETEGVEKSLIISNSDYFYSINIQIRIPLKRFLSGRDSMSLISDTNQLYS